MPQEMRPAQRRFTQRFQKPRRRPPPPVPMRHISNDDGEDYQNMPDEEYENAAALK